MQEKKQKILKLEQRPCVHVFAGVHLFLLLAYRSAVVKSKIIKLTLPENLKGGLAL